MPISDNEIHAILVDRVDARRQSVGIAVGVMSPEGQRVIAYGHPDVGDTHPVDGDTVFEIASLTKLFVALLLSEMAQLGEVSIDDPVSKYLPSTVKVPERNGRVVTLVDLATHTSGLDIRIPVKPKDPRNPYAECTVEQLYQGVSSAQLKWDIGSQFEYSSFGYALLGHVLGRRAQIDFESLMVSRVCGPLGMTSTRITPTPDMKVHLAIGHDASLQPYPMNNLGPAIAGSGAMRSTANDMLQLLAVSMGFTRSPMSPAVAAMLEIRRRKPQPGTGIALAWNISLVNGREIIWKEGGINGFCAWTGYDMSARYGTVVLSNVRRGVDDTGWHLLDPSIPLDKPPVSRQEVRVDTRVWDGYVGKYEFVAGPLGMRPGITVTVTIDAEHLYGTTVEWKKDELFPESERDYFFKFQDAQITFVTGSDGRAVELVWHQMGKEQHAKRMG